MPSPSFRVVAEDTVLWHVRPAATENPRPSWSVIQNEFPHRPSEISRTAKRVHISTLGFKLEIERETGNWILSDSANLPRLNFRAKGAGFFEGKPKFSLGIDSGAALFGLGETTGTFNKRGLARELWNIDVLGHASGIHPGLKSMYVSIPFLLLIKDGLCTGIFFDSTFRQCWDLAKADPAEITIQADGGDINCYFIVGQTPAQVVARYTALTGRLPMPPLWGLGYHQCRYSYKTGAEVESIAREFRQRQIPCDALYLDIHHMDGYRVFTFGKSFPQPSAMIRRLARQGFKVVTIVDPGVKADRKFGVFKRGKQIAAFVRNADNKADFVGKVWPGESVFPDFTNARVRAWWAKEQTALHKVGVAGIWNDMNEPANFALPSKTLAEDSLHKSDVGPLTHKEAHNVYGTQMARASREGSLAFAKAKRPFVITRAGNAGVQRHALVWTGDNSSTWEHLADSIPMLLNLSLSGVPYCGADVGGFLEDCTPELLERWTQLGAFMPFFRNHSNLESRPQEPWAFGPRTEEICRRYIQLRYQILPLLYSLMDEAHRSGQPIIRPLWWHNPDDEVALGCDDAFLLGRDLLVAPILRPGARARSVYLPAGNWFNFWTNEPFAGQQHVVAAAPPEIIPLFLRAGGILPCIPTASHTCESDWSRASLHCAVGGHGLFTMVEDDGISTAHESGVQSRRTIRLCSDADTGALVISAPQGEFASKVKTWRIVLRGLTRQPQLRVNGKPFKAKYEAASGGVVLSLKAGKTETCIRWRA